MPNQDYFYFIKACKDNQLEQVKQFVEKKNVNVNQVIDNASALIIASKEGFVDLVRYLEGKALP